jgi:hypothetical protein
MSVIFDPNTDEVLDDSVAGLFSVMLFLVEHNYDNCDQINVICT